jgi:hypothetical protein
MRELDRVDALEVTLVESTSHPSPAASFDHIGGWVRCRTVEDDLMRCRVVDFRPRLTRKERETTCEGGLHLRVSGEAKLTDS